MKVSASQRQAAKRLGIALPKPGVKWIHRPEGWGRLRYGTSEHATPMRGKQRCSHREYIKNRNGKVLKDPDTGYLAETHCKQIARWERNDTTSGLFNVVSRFCDKHAVKLGAK